MTTGITELDEQIAFWKTKPDEIVKAVVTAFFTGVTVGIHMTREQVKAAPAVKQPAAPGTKPDKEADQSADCVLHQPMSR